MSAEEKADRETIAVYDARVSEYAAVFERSEIDPDLVRFMKHLPAEGHVLDLGCGPAQASAVMRDNGFRVDPVDASPGMVALANETHDIHARLATFDDLTAVAAYDGVWANFSLLHARRERFAVHIAAIHTALKPAGVFHIGMKTGEGERRDHLGRRYCYFSEAELRVILEAGGFSVFATSKGRDKGLAGSVDPWITLLSRRT